MAALVVVAADQLSVQFLVERKHSVLEMVAEDVILGNQLHVSVRFVAQRSHYERLVSLKKRDIKLYVMCHTAKAYFPDRQSCSTLCRQPSGCARSVEVVAVYPSLGSYSVVGLLRWASLPFKKPFTYMDKMRPFGGIY